MYAIMNQYVYDVQRNDGIHTDVRIPIYMPPGDKYPIKKYPRNSWEVWISQSLEQKRDHGVTVTLNNGGFIVPYVFTDDEIHELMAFVRDANITEILWEGANIS